VSQMASECHSPPHPPFRLSETLKPEDEKMIFWDAVLVPRLRS
jgi:hypothetical protein